MLTVREVANRLNMSTYTVYTWIKRGIIEGAVKLPTGVYRVPESEIDRLLRPLEGRQRDPE